MRVYASLMLIKYSDEYIDDTILNLIILKSEDCPLELVSSSS